MRILLTADPEIPVPPQQYGGIQRIVSWLGEYLATQGHTVGLIAHPDSEACLEHVYSWPVDHSQSFHALFRNIPALRRACIQFRPDVVHSFARIAFHAYPLVKRIPTIMSYQRIPGASQTRAAFRLSGGRIQFTGCSEHISAIGRRSTPNWETIPNFLPDRLYTPDLDTPADAPLVFLSRLDSVKGVHTAIKIAQTSRIPLLIAGNIPHTESAKNYFKEKVEPHLDDPFISYVGPVNDRQKQQLLAGARALLLPLEWDEPFGIVFIEALACGTPVITAPRGAASEIVHHGEHGFLCSNISEYSTAISQLPDISRARCRQRFLEHFSESVVCRRYEETYTALVNG